MDYQIEYTDKPDADAIDYLCMGTAAEAFIKKKLTPIEQFAFFVRDPQNKIVGGINGYMYYGCLSIDQLYLEETLRGEGYGRLLVKKAEELAISKNCRFSVVNTMDWEAKGFYEKLGFIVEFERDGYDKESTLYCLKKNIMSVI